MKGFFQFFFLTPKLTAEEAADCATLPPPATEEAGPKNAREFAQPFKVIVNEIIIINLFINFTFKPCFFRKKTNHLIKLSLSTIYCELNL